MQIHYIVIFLLSVSVAAVSLLAAYQKIQIRKLRAFITQLLRIHRKDQKEPDH